MKTETTMNRIKIALLTTLLGVGLANFVQPLRVAVGRELPDDTSVSFAPADVSFYSASFDLAEQYGRFVSSRAYQKLKNLPLVQTGIQQLREKWQNEQDLKPLRQFLEDPDNQPLIDLAKDACGQEMFIYGDQRFGAWIGALAGMSNRINIASMRAGVQGEDPDAAMGKAIVEMLKDPELSEIPTTVIGFKLTDTAVAQSQLNRLESLIQDEIKEEAKRLEGRFTRQQLGDGEYLNLKLDGRMVPWDKALGDADLPQASKDELIEQLSQLTLAINLGIYRDYLLLAISKDDSAVQQLGSGELLIDGRELQPLKNYFSENVYSIGMVSGAMMRQLSNVDRQLEQLSAMAQTLVPMIPTLGADVKEDLTADAAAFFEQAKALQPRLDSISTISYGEAGHCDTVTYNWSEIQGWDSSESLSILDHVGGDPIGFFAGRVLPVAEHEEFARRWGRKFVSYVERIAVPMMDPQQTQLYELVKENMLPLLQRLDRANQEQLKPALADGEFAVVLDAQERQKQWQMQMPRSDRELPLPELCFVWTLSDSDKLKQAAREYFDVTQTAIKRMSEIMPDRVPPIDLPRPRTKPVGDAAMVYRYMIPPMAGVDPAIAPNAGVSDNVLVMSLVPSATSRLLDATPVAAAGVLKEPVQKELASAWQFKMFSLVDAVRPWARYSFQVAAKEGVQDPEVASQVMTILDVLQCIRTCSGYSYIDDGVMISHSRSEFQDLQE